MSTLVMAMEPVGSAGPSRKPTKVFHGLRRAQIRKLKICLTVILGQDERERIKAANSAYTPALFGVNLSSKEYKAMNTLMARCTQALDQTG